VGAAGDDPVYLNAGLMKPRKGLTLGAGKKMNVFYTKRIDK
jgi:hypothetical protein